MNFPILSSLILLPLVGSLFVLFIKDNASKNYQNTKYVALFVSFVNFLISIYLWYLFDNSTSEFQFIENKQWLKGFVNYTIGIDGISILFILLTTLITPLCIISIINSITSRVKEFLIAILVMESLMIGVFCSLDLIIFYLFFEGGLIPMFLIIGIWGGERRVYSAFKFFLFTLLGSILMLIAIITIYWSAGTTDVTQLYELGIDLKYQNLLWLAFFSSFAVKTPMWPVHTWLPDAHVQAPTAGSIILAGVLLKMGAYGFLRFSLPMLPQASQYFAPMMLVLSVVAIIYGGYLALAQDDLKKLVAYSSISHMGVVTLGLFVFNLRGLEGGILQMFNHGITTSALFLFVGLIYERTHTRSINDYGGLMKLIPVYTTFFALFTLASMALPGTNTFIGELLVLSGTFVDNKWFAAFAVMGAMLSAAYLLSMFKNVALGTVTNTNLTNIEDVNARELLAIISLAFFVIWIGLYPSPFLNLMHVSVEHLLLQAGSMPEVMQEAMVNEY